MEYRGKFGHRRGRPPKCAYEKFSKNVVLSSVIVSVILFILTSIVTETFIVIAFIPFFISILLRTKLDKLSVFAITFGSVLVGVLGATYGTESLAGFNEILNSNAGLELTLKYGLKYRFIIAAVTLVLYNFFLIMRVKKVLKDGNKTTKNSIVEEDPFKVEETKSKGPTLGDLFPELFEKLKNELPDD